MAAQHFHYDDFYNVIKHHIALIDRFECIQEQQFSLVYIPIEKKGGIDYAKEFEGILRETDIVFNKINHYIFFLPATDWVGADKIAKEICEYLDQPREDTIVNYPDDGGNAVERDYGVKL